MKTVLIYEQFGVNPLSFLVLKGDHTYLDGVYINATDCDEKLQEKLSKIIYDKDGQERHKMRTKFPTKAVREGAKVAICGFLP